MAAESLPCVLHAERLATVETKVDSVNSILMDWIETSKMLEKRLGKIERSVYLAAGFLAAIQFFFKH